MQVPPEIKVKEVKPNPRRPPYSDTCCFTFSGRMLSKKQIRKYFFTSPSCSKTAVLFVTVTGSHICVNPRLLWVQKIIENLDKDKF
ncbi:C-C motif chemokine 5-like [Cyprinodon tularosa]|uniref:C-C motif chemokine 5-like n=1 Tax=Cyprinodon tularosa TaxID=77115 RepID=UPI0018E21BC2|nr:C-C motif chemokine 5-like [Cyprinodon tularosa]